MLLKYIYRVTASIPSFPTYRLSLDSPAVADHDVLELDRLHQLLRPEHGHHWSGSACRILRPGQRNQYVCLLVCTMYDVTTHWLVIQIRLNEREAISAFWTLASMSFGLMIASVISAVHNQLSFFNALAVQDLVLSVTVRCAAVSLTLIMHHVSHLQDS